MFNWMNRKLYYFLKVWILVLLAIAVFLSIIAGCLYLGYLTYLTWGSLGVVAFLVVSTLFVGSIFYSWLLAEELHNEELEQQMKIEQSLKKDWTLYKM